jgi:hypothetical protein
MDNIYVTDMTHFEGIPSGPEYKPARRIAQFFGSIVYSASVFPGDKQIEAALFCRRRPNRIPCPGHLQIRRDSASGIINWHCTHCDDQGEISSWEGTSWDLSRQEPNHLDNQKIHELVLTRDEIHELRGSPTLSLKYKNLLYHAILVHGDIVIRTTLAELDSLQQEIAFDVSLEEKRSRRRDLEYVYERMDILLKQEDDKDPVLLDTVNTEAIARLKELGFHCQSCGHCCLGLGFQLTLDHNETRRWRKFGEVVPSNYGQYYLRLILFP